MLTAVDYYTFPWINYLQCIVFPPVFSESPTYSYNVTTLLSVLQCYVTVPFRTLSGLVSTKVPYMGRVYTPVSLVLPGLFPEPPWPLARSRQRFCHSVQHLTSPCLTTTTSTLQQQWRSDNHLSAHITRLRGSLFWSADLRHPKPSTASPSSPILLASLLPPDVLPQVFDVISKAATSTTPYKDLKTALLSTFQSSIATRLKELDDGKPTDLLRRNKQLLGDKYNAFDPELF